MKVSKWNSKGGGMKKHRTSGVSHNHAHAIQRAREENKRIAEEEELRRLRKPKMFGRVSDLLKK